MYVTLGRDEPAPRSTTETPGPASPLALTRVLDTTTSEFRSVCRIYVQAKGGHSVGSGVLITPRHVLTSAHVISPPENPTGVLSITVFAAQNGPTPAGQGIKSDGWAVKHGWSPNCCRSWDEDYGIIRLSKAPKTGIWPITSFDPRRLQGATAHLAGYPTRPDDGDAQVMYRSRGGIIGTIQIDSCIGLELDRTLWPTIDETTRLVAHGLDSAKSMSGGPLWSFVDGKRVLWGLHAGVDSGKRKKGILLNKKVRAQIAHWVSREFPAL